MDQAGYDRLTTRERACLRLLDADHNQDDVAKLLGIGSETVRTHLKRARSKFGNRAARVLAREMRQYEAGPPAPGHRWQVIPERVVSSLAPGLRRRGVDGSIPALLRDQGAGNDLTILQRLVAIACIAGVLAIAFGMLAVGLRVVSDLIGRGS